MGLCVLQLHGQCPRDWFPPPHRPQRPRQGRWAQSRGAARRCARKWPERDRRAPLGPAVDREPSLQRRVSVQMREASLCVQLCADLQLWMLHRTRLHRRSEARGARRLSTCRSPAATGPFLVRRPRGQEKALLSVNERHGSAAGQLLRQDPKMCRVRSSTPVEMRGNVAKPGAWVARVHKRALSTC